MRATTFAGSVLAAAVALVAVALVAAGDDRPPPSGEGATRLTKTRFPKFFLDVSPDGKHLAYSRHYPHRRAANLILVGLHVVGADGANDRRILEPFDREVQIQEHPRWSPDGRTIALSGGGNDTGNSTKDTFLCDVTDGVRVTNLRKLAPGAGVKVGEEPCWSPDGRRLVATTTAQQLIVIDADGKNKKTLLQTHGVYCHQPDWSPDGQWIAFASDRADKNVEVYKIRHDGSDLTRLTNDPALDSRPRWSPDGKWLLFTSNRSGNPDVFLMRADGGGVRNLTPHEAVDDHAVWSPDGRWFAFVSMRDGGFDIYRAAVPQELEVAPRLIAQATPAAAAQTPRIDDTAKQDAAAKDVADKDAAEITDGLVAHFDCDSDAEKIVRSRVGKLTGKLMGPTLVAGKVGKALEFDGKDDLVDFGDPAAFRPTDQLTISLWVKPDGPPSAGEPLLFGRGTESWGLTYYTDGQVWFYIAGGGNQLKQGIAAKEWSHVAGAFDGKEMRLYVNGELAAERKSMFAEAVNGGRVLAGLDPAKKTHFAGAIDEIRLYRRALSARGIRQLAKGK